MIQAKDLRIGNIIESGTIVHLKIINGGAIVELECESDKYNGRRFIGNPYPEPLTEQWLIKFGFIWLEDSMRFVVGVLKKETRWKYELELFYTDGCFFFEYNGREIKYVHQLQNLYFDLTGKELTYEKHTPSPTDSHS